MDLQTIKDNPIKLAVGVITTCVSLVTGVFVIDDRYVHHDDLSRIEQVMDKNSTEVLNALKDFKRSEYNAEILSLSRRVKEGNQSAYDEVRLEQLKLLVEQLDK